MKINAETFADFELVPVQVEHWHRLTSIPHVRNFETQCVLGRGLVQRHLVCPQRAPSECIYSTFMLSILNLYICMYIYYIIHCTVYSMV